MDFVIQLPSQHPDRSVALYLHVPVVRLVGVVVGEDEGLALLVHAPEQVQFQGLLALKGKERKDRLELMRLREWSPGLRDSPLIRYLLVRWEFELEFPKFRLLTSSVI